MSRYLVYVLVFLFALSSCKKDIKQSSEAESENKITLSINGGVEIAYNQPSYNPSTEVNGLYYIGFARTYYITATRESQNYNIVEFSFNESNILSNPLPYTITKYQMYVENIVPQNLGTFNIDSGNDTHKGHVTIIITSAKDQRLIGKYNGVLYSSYNTFPKPDSISVKGMFDVKLPQYVGY